MKDSTIRAAAQSVANAVITYSTTNSPIALAAALAARLAFNETVNKLLPEQHRTHDKGLVTPHLDMYLESTNRRQRIEADTALVTTSGAEPRFVVKVGSDESHAFRFENGLWTCATMGRESHWRGITINPKIQ